MGLFRPLNRGQTLEFSASWALGPEAHRGQAPARPGTSRGHPHRHKGEWDTPLCPQGQGHSPLGEKDGGPTLRGSARRLNLQTDPPQPAPKDLRHPSLDPARLRGHSTTGPSNPPPPHPRPSQDTRKALEQMQMPQTSRSQWGGRGGRQALLGFGGREPGSLPTPEQGGWILGPLVQNEI